MAKNYTVKELRKIATARKIKGRSKLKTKAQLLRALGLEVAKKPEIKIGGDSKRLDKIASVARAKTRKKPPKKPAVGVKAIGPLSDKLPGRKAEIKKRLKAVLAKEGRRLRKEGITGDARRKAQVQALTREVKKIRQEQAKNKAPKTYQEFIAHGKTLMGKYDAVFDKMAKGRKGFKPKQGETAEMAANRIAAMAKGEAPLMKQVEKFRKELLKTSKYSREEAKAFVNSRLYYSFKNRSVLEDAVMMQNGKQGKTLELITVRDNPVRASADELLGTVTIHKGSSPETIHHEMAHHTEFSSETVLKAAEAFRDARAEKHPNGRVKLHMLNGREQAVKGKFITPYAGRVYGKKVKGTEIVSVGAQHFATAKSMAHLAVNDREHFYFMLGVMRA